tara:strand:+ start:1534 stop:2499 length:966 start_codon:yes stop_codon:yes gene_type:complete
MMEGKLLPYTIVTRASQLAKRQTALFVEAFAECFPGDMLLVQPVQTRGDHTTGPIYNLKKAFVGELERALLDGSAQVAVHSLKDMSVYYQEGLRIAAVLPRARAEDVMVSHSYTRISDLPSGAKVGTCSARRAAQIRQINPSIRIALCRGNVHTRLEKLKQGQYDALVLAGAGLDRLSIRHCPDLNIVALSLDDFVPAGGQGAIAVQARSDQSDLLLKLARVNHLPTYRAVMLERDIIKRFGGNCSTPLGVYVQPKDHGFSVSVFLGDVFGHQAIKKTDFWPYQSEGYSGKVNDLVDSICREGGQEVLDGYQKDLGKFFDD